MKENEIVEGNKLTAFQLAHDLENDYDRFPLPFCFDPREEQMALWRRKKRCERLAERFVSIMQIRQLKTQTPKP